MYYASKCNLNFQFLYNGQLWVLYYDQLLIHLPFLKHLLDFCLLKCRFFFFNNWAIWSVHNILETSLLCYIDVCSENIFSNLQLTYFINSLFWWAEILLLMNFNLTTKKYNLWWFILVYVDLWRCCPVFSSRIFKALPSCNSIWA